MTQHCPDSRACISTEAACQHATLEAAAKAKKNSWQSLRTDTKAKRTASRAEQLPKLKEQLLQLKKQQAKI
jgi:hypothetical protein